MKGILLAGGSGSRLYPLTKSTSKQLLPVYDKPMIYYPLSILMLFNIREILIISTPQDTPNIQRLFGNGSHLGLDITYEIQEKPEGIAQAFIIGEKFIADDDVCLILGDNIFYMGNQFHNFDTQVKKNKNKGATIFACHVPNPESLGVVEFDKDFNVLSIEEKPKAPKSNYAACGLYFYPSDVVGKAKQLKPSKRGEYEITDINNMYLQEDRLSAVVMRRGTAWLDAGTPDTLMESSTFVQVIEKRQGLKLACLEEIAYVLGFIDDKRLKSLIDELKPGNYKKYLEKIYEESHGIY